MKVRNLTILVATYLFAAAAPLLAHCEIPCGIYGDEARFAALDEDLRTVEKAMGQIAALNDTDDAQSANQLARWVSAKEEHANRIQRVVSQYFMTQRLKVPDAEDEAAFATYSKKLVLLHRILRGAMKCKQSVDLEQVEVVRDLIHEFKHAYEAK